MFSFHISSFSRSNIVDKKLWEQNFHQLIKRRKISNNSGGSSNDDDCTNGKVKCNCLFKWIKVQNVNWCRTVHFLLLVIQLLATWFHLRTLTIASSETDYSQFKNLSFLLFVSFDFIIIFSFSFCNWFRWKRWFIIFNISTVFSVIFCNLTLWTHWNIFRSTCANRKWQNKQKRISHDRSSYQLTIDLPLSIIARRKNHNENSF